MVGVARSRLPGPPTGAPIAPPIEPIGLPDTEPIGPNVS